MPTLNLLMNHRSVQRLPARSQRSLTQTRVYRFCWAIGLVSLFAIAGSFLSLNAMAQSVSGTVALSSDYQSVLAEKTTPTMTQVPPNVINRLRHALSKQTNMPETKLKVVEASAETWSNGCLGLAKAGEMCTEALVSGWRVTFASGYTRWTYRADKQAHVYRLEP